MELNQNIRRVRKEMGLSQEQLAETMGVSTASVSKWETGQSAPELTVLMELADFFGVSVDALLGHRIDADRMDAELVKIDSYFGEGNYEAADQTAQKLLRRYPNEYRVLDQVSGLYHNLALVTGQKQYMNQAIKLTERLFALLDEPSGPKWFELKSRMANHYELIQDWDMARKYYEEGNVSHVNDRALARCLANAGQNESAVKAVSKVFSRNLYELLSDCFMLAQIWLELEQRERAEAVLEWGCDVLRDSGSRTASHYAFLGATMHTELARMKNKRGERTLAEAHIRTAVEILQNGGECTERTDFLHPESCGTAKAAETRQGMEMILTWLRDEPDLLAAAQKAAKETTSTRRTCPSGERHV